LIRCFAALGHIWVGVRIKPTDRASRNDVEYRIELVYATETASFFFFSVKTTRGYDVAAISGTFGPADEQTELQCFQNIRDIKQEAGRGPAHSWYVALVLQAWEMN
jgi:hypothetical protein